MAANGVDLIPYTSFRMIPLKGESDPMSRFR